MPGRRSKVLTEVELELMEIIWEQGESTAASVRKALSSTRQSARTTVRTMLEILERKGYLRHRAEGRIHVYEPVIDREEGTRRMIRYLADRISGGSTSLLVQHILKVEQMSGEELNQIKHWVEEEAKEQEGEG